MTLIEISHEGTATWPAGFCRVPASPSDFNERLRFLPEQPSSRTKAEPKCSDLVHWLTFACNDVHHTWEFADRKGDLINRPLLATKNEVPEVLVAG
jgi:hypothetical protein